MQSKFSTARRVFLCIVLVFSVVLIPYSHVEHGSGGFGFTLFCVHVAIYISVVGIIDTCVLIFRGVWDRITPTFFFRAFIINLGLFALMWLILVASLH
ncbi:hypothetical protein [Gimesia alba]|uniref:hypothetical protein n=1 Tax=Gimesia alba TaxID=2527973 RepID=UPI00119E2C27|nr:hypothetical protein [Gimesia alba]